jgi:ribonuclease inhibitor
MKTIYIDCQGVTSAQEVWRRYLEAAQPEGSDTFGCNLDAFWDAIEGGGPGWPGDVELVFINTRDLAPLQLSHGASFLEGLQSLASKASRTRVHLR